MSSGGYNPLDDVPFQLRRAHASPTPTHFSLVSSNPSPETSRAMINQQVMSPTAQPAQSLTATASIMQQQRTMQLEIPPGMLQELQQSVAWDSEVLSDMRAAFQELHDRMYHRTGLLGTAANALHDGYNAVSFEIQRLQGIVDAHTTALETLVSTNSSLRRELDDMHAQLQANTRDVSQLKMGQLQWQSQIEAHITQLEVKLSEVCAEQEAQSKKADDLFHDCAETVAAGTDPAARSAIETLAGRVSTLEDVVKTALKGTEDTQRDLLGVHATLNAVQNTQEQLVSQFDQLLEEQRTPRRRTLVEDERAGKPGPSNVPVVTLTPGAPDSMEEVDKESANKLPDPWDSGLDWPDAGSSRVTLQPIGRL